MKLSKNDLRKLVQESVVKLMSEAFEEDMYNIESDPESEPESEPKRNDENYIANKMEELSANLQSIAVDFVENLDDDLVTEDTKESMLSNIADAIDTAVYNTRRSAVRGY